MSDAKKPAATVRRVSGGGRKLAKPNPLYGQDPDEIVKRLAAQKPGRKPKGK